MTLKPHPRSQDNRLTRQRSTSSTTPSEELADLAARYDELFERRKGKNVLPSSQTQRSSGASTFESSRTTSASSTNSPAGTLIPFATSRR